ncbi:tRNA (adenosine(37)-N6)-threonylcarbamoyltransferase complex ATPase subunit type 1 TsaE [Pseudophaeobacter sp. EL27]|uniref:tRNA (adenosine(37)-N6)-threonylcarbamoyltransferase complex ATPase subunit type 1 TsaE n=1 Tax=Pseudophaeobacter sp. EL27 TaxID=2107580 RepID=UPI000EFCB343|nr:tRNA (adenosine(37)-N6)-threonylcarbamoyltransferase complex ATPase subunit type 1 TsaE [Pseudophaeobacter sp. EL27]
MTQSTDPAPSAASALPGPPAPICLRLTSPEATAELAQQLAHQLHPGDCLLLEGPIGAGKTHFARSLIQSLMVQPEDVPSPTFTLVQTYDVPSGELWHADLYRLSALEEIEELGLMEAFDEAICLIEWPDRLAELTPAHALYLTLSLDPAEEDCRHLRFSWSDAKWQTRMDEIENDRS